MSLTRFIHLSREVLPLRHMMHPHLVQVGPQHQVGIIMMHRLLEIMVRLIVSILDNCSLHSLFFSVIRILLIEILFSANAPSPYLPSTPGGQPMTPSSASYLPGTPGGQPMTPGGGGLDMMSPTTGLPSLMHVL